MPSALPEQRVSMHEALQRIMGAVAEHGPYDGIFGFSQGATLATILSSPQSWRDCFGFDYCPWKFVILANAAGTKALSSHGLIGSNDTPPLALECGKAPIGLPSFHLIGSMDTHNRGASLEAKALYAPKMATSFTHPFGHELPSKLRMDEELSQSLSTFFSQFDGSAEAVCIASEPESEVKTPAVAASVAPSPAKAVAPSPAKKPPPSPAVRQSPRRQPPSATKAPLSNEEKLAEAIKGLLAEDASLGVKRLVEKLQAMEMGFEVSAKAVRAMRQQM